MEKERSIIHKFVNALCFFLLSNVVPRLPLGWKARHATPGALDEWNVQSPGRGAAAGPAWHPPTNRPAVPRHLPHEPKRLIPGKPSLSLASLPPRMV